MKIKKIVHRNVNEDGTFSDKKGAIVTNGFIRMSKGEGCGIPTCHCSDGHWVTIGTKLKDGIVEVLKVQFDDMDEMELFLKSHELIMDTETAATYPNQTYSDQ